MKIRAVYVLILLLMISFYASAEILPLQKVLETTYEKNPDIQLLQAQHDSARAKKRLALAPAEPTISISNNDLTEQFHLNTAASTVIQFAQPLGFPGRAFLNRSMLNDQADSLYYQMKAMKLQIGVNVKTAYYNLQLAQENLKLNADTRFALEQILAIAKRRYESGASAQVDYISAQVALLSNQNDLEDLKVAEQQARATLNVQLKNPVDALIEAELIPISGNPSTDLTKINLNSAIEKMLQNRNEILAAQSQLRASSKASKLAWMSILPDFQFLAGTTLYRMPYASPYSGVPDLAASGSWPTHTYSIGLQFTVPLWFLLNEREVVVGASHDHLAAERNLDVVFNQSKVALENAVDAIHSNGFKIENFEKHILPLAEQSLKLALVGYSSGKVDFQTLSAAAVSRRQARQSHSSAVVAYLINYAIYQQLIAEAL